MIKVLLFVHGKVGFGHRFILIAGMALMAMCMFIAIKSARQFSQKILVVFFLSAFCFLLYYYSYLHRIRELGAVAVFFGNEIGFLIGPLLLFQIKSLVLPYERFRRQMFLQLIPFGLIWLLVSVPLSISMATEYRGYVKWYADHEPWFNIPENIFFLTYIVLANRYLRKIRHRIKENYSSLKSHDLSWYKHLLIGFAVIVILDTGCTVYELYFPMVPWNIGTVIAFGFVAMYAYLGYKGTFQSQILLPEFLVVPDDVEAANAPVRKKVTGPLEKYAPEAFQAKIRDVALTI